MCNQRQEIADQACDHVDNPEPETAIHPLDPLATVPKRRHIQDEVQGSEMQEERTGQTPPFPILRRRPEISPPCQLDGVLRVPQAGAIEQHRHEHQNVDRNEQRRQAQTWHSLP